MSNNISIHKMTNTNLSTDSSSNKNHWRIYNYVPSRDDYDENKPFMRMEEIVAAGFKYAEYRRQFQTDCRYGFYLNLVDEALSIPSGELIDNIMHYLKYLAGLEYTVNDVLKDEAHQLFEAGVNLPGLYKPIPVQSLSFRLKDLFEREIRPVRTSRLNIPCGDKFSNPNFQTKYHEKTIYLPFNQPIVIMCNSKPKVPTKDDLNLPFIRRIYRDGIHIHSRSVPPFGLSQEVFKTPNATIISDDYLSLTNTNSYMVFTGGHHIGKAKYLESVGKFLNEPVTLPVELLTKKKIPVVNEIPLDEDDIEIVMNQTDASREKVIAALKKNGNIIDAILDLTDIDKPITNNKNNLKHAIKLLSDIAESFSNLTLLFSTNEDLKTTGSLAACFTKDFTDSFRNFIDIINLAKNEDNYQNFKPNKDSIVHSTGDTKKDFENISLILKTLLDTLYKLGSFVKDNHLDGTKTQKELEKINFTAIINKFSQNKFYVDIEGKEWENIKDLTPEERGVYFFKRAAEELKI
jgi:hypothetical protein